MDDKILFRMLKSTPFFYELSPAEFDEIVQKTKMHRLKVDSTIIREKEKENSLFFVVCGVLRVTIKNPANGKNILLSKLGVGNFFGQFSLITRRLRTATVSSITDSDLLEIPTEIYERVVMKYPSVRRFLVDLCIQHERHTAKIMESLKIDRRRSLRFKIRGEIRFQEYTNGGDSKIIKVGKGTLFDMSEGGMSFQVNREKIDGKVLEMYSKDYKAKIEVEGFPASIKVLGRVVSFEIGITNRDLASYYIVRMKFKKIDRNDQEAFRGLLRSH